MLGRELRIQLCYRLARSPCVWCLRFFIVDEQVLCLGFDFDSNSLTFRLERGMLILVL